MRTGLKMLVATQARANEGNRRNDRDGRNDYQDNMRMAGDRGGQMHYDHEGEYRRESMNWPGYYPDMRRGGYGRMADEGEMRYAGGMEEMRRGRRRYKDGRFAPQNRYFPPEYESHEEPEEMDHYPGYIHEPINNYPDQRRGRGLESRIGFNMGGETHRGETLTFPGQHMMQKGKGGRLDKETAEMWVEHMRNEDGTIGAHWTMDQTEQVRKQKNLDCDPVEFWVAMNAAYSDLSKVAKKYNTNTVDYYVDYVKAYWFNDQDAVPHKLSAYYDSVVKK